MKNKIHYLFWMIMMILCIAAYVHGFITDGMVVYRLIFMIMDVAMLVFWTWMFIKECKRKK